MKKRTKIILTSARAFTLALGLAVAIPFAVLGIRTSGLNADYAYLKNDVTYQAKAEVAGLDLAGDDVTVYNPYGYVENITVGEFLDRTSFNAYENMPLFLSFGFAFGAFDKNTVFYAA